MAERIHERMTATEFFELPESMLPHELIDGELIVSPAPVYKHQNILMRLISLLLKIVQEDDLLTSPSDVYIDDTNVVQPDLFWVSPENTRCELRDGRWYGAPDLVIEILSPGTARRDKTVKFDLYEKQGVREYWMVEPEAAYLEVWGLRDAQFVKIGIFGPDERFSSPVLQAEIVLESIFKPTTRQH